MSAIGRRLIQLFFFVPGAALVAALGPPDGMRVARFSADSGRRAPIVFLYSISIYAMLIWVALMIRSVQGVNLPATPPPAAPPMVSAQDLTPPQESPSVPNSTATLPMSPEAVAQSDRILPPPVVELSELSAGKSISFTPPAATLMMSQPTDEPVNRCVVLSMPDRLVCESPELATLDEQVTKRVDTLKSRLPIPKQIALRSQTDEWYARRATDCPDTLADAEAISCLKEFYQKYIKALSKPIEHAPDQRIKSDGRDIRHAATHSEPQVR
jgi:hypothetical protein